MHMSATGVFVIMLFYWHCYLCGCACQCENARLALCEHPQWTPVVVMLGLLQCSVQPALKAHLLHALAAFGKSPEIAASLWQSLEYTQVSAHTLCMYTLYVLSHFANNIQNLD